MKKLLKGGTIVSGKGCRKMDILIEDEVIKEVGEDLSSPDAELVDVTGRLLFPGFIDGHTHFDLEVSGTVTADDFTSGTKAAIAGGTTTIVDYATQYKGESLNEALENWHKKADDKCSCDYGFHMAISDWNPRVAAEITDMTAAGVSSYKLYMTYDDMVLNDKEIYQVLKCLKANGAITGVHCENKGIIDALVEERKKAGQLSLEYHAKTRPEVVESEAINRLLVLARLAEAPVIIVHLSSQEGYQVIRKARETGQSIFVETCPQYLMLNDNEYKQSGFEGSKYIISPPLRKRESSVVLWDAVTSGQVQTIATDHCSFTMKQKEMGRNDFTKIPCGMPGVETRPVLIYTFGVKEQNINLSQMCRMLSENPAKLYGMYPRKGCIAPGSDADIVVWNPDEEWVLSLENQHSKADYCPYEEYAVHGKAERVYLRGTLVAENGDIVAEGQGRYVPRGRWSEV